MTITHELLLPGNFIRDREERDLDCGHVLWTKDGKRAFVTCSAEVLADIRSDAVHQYDGTDGEGLEWLRRSAKLAVRRIDEHIKEYMG